MEINLEKGKSYLVEETYGFGSKIIKKILVEESTQTCYKIKWEDGTHSWLMKCEFDGGNAYVKRPYQVIEELGVWETKS